MSLSRRQQHQLHRIETGLLRSDPQFTAMLGIFGRLSAGKAMPAWEQVPTRQQSIRQAASLTVKATIVVAEAIVLLLRAVLALVIAVGTRHGHRLPAPGPERTRRGRGADGRPDPAGQSLRLMSTSTLMADPAAGRAAWAPRTAFVLAGGAALGAMQAGMVHALYERGITGRCGGHCPLTCRTGAPCITTCAPGRKPAPPGA